MYLTDSVMILNQIAPIIKKILEKGKLSDRELELLILASISEQNKTIGRLFNISEAQFKVMCGNQEAMQKNIQASLNEIKNLKQDLYRKGNI
jgi:DNA-binding CsgD family transcriptional regulator